MNTYSLLRRVEKLEVAAQPAAMPALVHFDSRKETLGAAVERQAGDCQLAVLAIDTAPKCDA